MLFQFLFGQIIFGQIVVRILSFMVVLLSLFCWLDSPQIPSFCQIMDHLYWYRLVVFFFDPLFQCSQINLQFLVKKSRSTDQKHNWIFGKHVYHDFVVSQETLFLMRTSLSTKMTVKLLEITKVHTFCECDQSLYCTFFTSWRYQH